MTEKPSEAYFPFVLQGKYESNAENEGKQCKSLIGQNVLDNFILNLVLPVSMAGSMNHESLHRLHEEDLMTAPSMRLQMNLEILTGSTAEGLSLPEITLMKGPLRHYTYAADNDIKYVFTSLTVDSKNKKAFAEMDSSVSPPGFTRLRFNFDWNKLNRSAKTRFIEARERLILSSPKDYVNKDGFIIRKKIIGILRREMKDHVHSVDNEVRQMKLAKGTIPKVSFSQHGPAITADMIDPVSKMMASKDYVLALLCPRWPADAQEWLTRRRVWPSSKDCKSIVKRGCHIVPKQHHLSNDPCEFIISFSAIEKYVAHFLSISQKRVYMLFKLLFKSCLNKAHRGLTSYHLKTTLFWLCEKVPVEKWKEENPIECLEWLLFDLECYLKNRRLPHYFIPECNLLDHMTSLSAECICSSIQKVRANLSQEILNSTELFRFSWLSRDISLSYLMQSILKSNNITWGLLRTCTLGFISQLLQKGEMHVAISILCGTTNCEALPLTEEIIRQVEATINLESELYFDHGYHDQNIVGIQGLIAMLYNQRAMECLKAKEMGQYRQNFWKSFQLFESCLKIVPSPLWIIGEYYNLLSTQDMHINLLRHFTAKLHQKGDHSNLYEEGTYTTISNHNWLTTDEFFVTLIDDGEFIVPTTAYVLHKAFKSATTVAENSAGHQSTKMFTLAKKIRHDFDQWTKVKTAVYPEKIDENIYLLLGLCSIRDGNKKLAEKYLQIAANYGGPMSDTSDMVLYPVTMIDKMRTVTKEDLRLHPYKTSQKYRGKQRSLGHIKVSKLVYKRQRVTVLPFIHW